MTMHKQRSSPARSLGSFTPPASFPSQRHTDTSICEQSFPPSSAKQTSSEMLETITPSCRHRYLPCQPGVHNPHPDLRPGPLLHAGAALPDVRPAAGRLPLRHAGHRHRGAADWRVCAQTHGGQLSRQAQVDLRLAWADTTRDRGLVRVLSLIIQRMSAGQHEGHATLVLGCISS